MTIIRNIFSFIALTIISTVALIFSLDFYGYGILGELMLVITYALFFVIPFSLLFNLIAGYFPFRVKSHNGYEYLQWDKLRLLAIANFFLYLILNIFFISIEMFSEFSFLFLIIFYSQPIFMITQLLLNNLPTKDNKKLDVGKIGETIKKNVQSNSSVSSNLDDMLD